MSVHVDVEISPLTKSYQNTYSIHPSYEGPPNELPSEGKDIIWKFGPVEVALPAILPRIIQYIQSPKLTLAQVKGKLNTDTKAVDYYLTVGGVRYGVLSGNLEDNLVTELDAPPYSGYTKLYMKNENEMWMRLDIEISYNGNFEGDHKVMSF